MAEIGNTSVFRQADADNNSGTVPTWAEGQAPSQINDSARALQGAVTREWNWRNATRTSTGSANAYVLTYSVVPAALYDGQIFTFYTNFANTGSATLNINSLGAKTIKKIVAGVKTALSSGELASGDLISVAYNLADDSFVLVNVDGDAVALASANAFTGNNTHAGTETFNNTVTIAKELALSGDLTPSQITADQNDYAPTGHATATVFRLSSDASRDITGLAGGADGRMVLLVNAGSNLIQLDRNDAASAEANRFIFDSNGQCNLGAEMTLVGWYDNTSQKWRIVGPLTAGQPAMEAAGTGVAFSSPFFQHYHPGHPKAWGEFLANSTTIETDYNVDTVADTATGAMTVNLDTDMSGVDWACLVSRAEDDMTLVYSATYDAKAAGSVILRSVVEAGSGADPSSGSGNATWSFLGMGDLA